MVKVYDGETITFTDTSKLIEDISTLYLNQKYSDVILDVNGQKIHAHKAILSVRSVYFESLFSEASQDNEITIADVSQEAFLNLLKYIYTGNITISSNIELTLNVLTLAHQHSVKDLESGLIKQLTSILNLKNICSILNVANLYDLEELRDACHSFMDSNAPEMLSNDCFNDLTQKSMIKLLKRDTFVAPEIEIFKTVSKWCEKNNDVEDSVIQCVRLSSLSVVEIVSIVWPSKLVKCEDLLHAIAEIVDVKPKLSQPRATLLVDENIASPLHKAIVISGAKTGNLLTGNRDVSKYAEIGIDGTSGYIVKFDTASYLNHINMMLWDDDTRYYSYYIEISLDQKKWRRIIDFSRYACRSVQNLYFEQQIAQYIKIVGTFNTANAAFHLVYVEAYFKSSVPKFLNGILYPDTNVATPEKKAKVIEGQNPQYLLNGDAHNYDGSIGYTFHTIGTEHIIVQLAQPFMISSMKLLLWNQDDRSYKYLIETSVNKNDWQIVVDRRNEPCKSWQTLRFKEIAVVFIRITGTHNTANNGFHCVHFECPTPDE